MKKLNKKKMIILGVAVLVAVLFIMVVISLTGTNSSKRLDGASSHKLSKEEKTKVKEVVESIGDVESFSMKINNKIIRIHFTLKEEQKVDDVKSKCNEIIKNIDKKNLEFYDVEVFVLSSLKDSEDYPIIGYKHKSQESFVW